MQEPIKILHLEDLESDSRIIERVLKKSDLAFNYRWVSDKNSFEQNLAEFSPDIILSDHHLPTINSVKALSLVRESKKRVPFILISGTVSEKFAVHMVDEGIDDYILKDRLERLPGAIRNALRKLNAEKDREAQYLEIINKEKRFRALIENISDGIILVDETGKSLYHSPSVKRISGFDFEEMKDNTIFQFLHPSDIISGTEAFRNAMQNPEKPVQFSFRMKHKNGNYIWVEGTITNLLQEESVNAFNINYRDITLRKTTEQLLQKSEANLRTIFNNTNVAYVFADKDYKVISYNQQATLRYKKELHATLKEGDNMLEYLPHERQPESEERFKRVLNGEKISYETRFPEGNNVSWYRVDMFPVNDLTNNPLGFIVSSEDITQRKLIELERNTMTSDLIKHNKDLEQFAYIISHNLRSPVANILGLSNIISRNQNLSPENFKKSLDGLTLSAKKLDEIIIDLNFILQTRRETSERKENVNFNELVNDIKSIINHLIVKEDVSIITDFAIDHIFTIKSYMHSIFFNLISNSIKYRRTGVRTEIYITNEKMGDKLVIKFKDNGLGIDMKLYGDKLFGLYKKFHTHVDGKGMGLYMVKTQVEILGGTINVDSEVNKGTLFTLTFGM